MNIVELVKNATLLQIVIGAAIILFSWFIYDIRFKQKHGKDIPPGYEKTQEVFIDPTTDKKLRVYYNSQTGERFYREER